MSRPRPWAASIYREAKGWVGPALFALGIVAFFFLLGVFK